MSEKGQTTDLIEHLRKKMIERAEGRGLQDSEVIRISQLLDVHLVALMRPRVEGAAHANSPSAEQSHLPPASGEGRRWDVSRIRLHRRRFQVIGRALDTTGWS
ncbi:aspartyl-phosphate phosphatase Spo0E family protein [Alicyclobacillus sendaiensis]|uniref:Aspartyl-phosphate phosphatase Spo0E family protein n=1 Tax=Alicyclobacillus sendaiensis PA2 TaxID=3029425 RepID=A0ABT6XXG6_ALISE|nr:aspartyl-phosphate phosphatase Spo0E family protein [Alicyclobacillus sendaiensis]MDI9259294.1 aspartyl-phosphate phosphatase Spo0E family protein [Alicyclobacillus sendaiensis PA2]